MNTILMKMTSENAVFLKMLFAGLMFGIWPLFMNRSGLNGNFSTVAIVVIATLMLIPTALIHLPQQESNMLLMWALYFVVILALGILAYKLIPIIPTTKDSPPILWTLVILATVMSTLGLLAFNSALGEVSPESVSMYFLTCVLVQVAVPIVYYVIKTGWRCVTLRDVIGFVATVIAVIALKPKG